MKKAVGMIGEGAWGTAVATLLANNGYQVKLWCHDPNAMKAIQETRYNPRYLPDVYLDKNIIPMTDLSEVICDVEWVFEAIPIKFLRDILQHIKPCFNSKQQWVILSKGIEQKTLLLPTQMLDEIFEYDVHKAVVLGPSFAQNLARKEITAVTLATTDCDSGFKLQDMLANNYFRPYLSLDLMGVQIGGALKNVIALGIGMLEGAGFTDNAKAFLFTRGLHEIVQLALVYGGKQETLYGLSGVGDLVLTAMGSLSRNKEVGRRLGQGEKLEDILKQTGYIPEGINTVQSVQQIIEQKKLDLPLCHGIYQVIFEHEQIKQVLEELMARPLEQECAL